MADQSVKEIISTAIDRQPPLLQVLLAVQDLSPRNYVSEDDIRQISVDLGCSRCRVYSTASFYDEIALEPRGENIIRVCTNAPCENAGKEAILDALRQQLAIDIGGTTDDGQFKSAGYSPYYAARLFKEVIGTAPFDYIRQLRLSGSATVLSLGKRPIVDVALEFVFNSHEGFTRAFSRQFGMTPRDFRRKIPPVRLFMPDRSARIGDGKIQSGTLRLCLG